MTDQQLRRLVAGVLAPGFNGVAVPGWLRAAIDDGLGSVVLFGHNLAFDADSPAEPAAHFDRIAALTTHLRADRADLLIASDEEGGDVSRIEVGTGSCLPGAAALGVVGDAALTRQVGAAHGRLLRAVGIDCGLAPVADVNSNPDNPVIGVRSFGADAAAVADQVVAYLDGLQGAGVLACAKHFPGHGNSAVDSHHALPYLQATADDLEGRELIPFRAAIRAGVAAVMPGHLVVPAVDELPASTSRRWMEILRSELGFDGLVITDALDMAAVAAPDGVPAAAVRALAAGVDLLCLGNTCEIDDQQMYDNCLEAIAAAVRDGRINEQQLVDSAARRSRALAAIASAPVGDIGSAATELITIGRTSAERAIEAGLWSGSAIPMDSAPMVVDLRFGINMAAGPTSSHLITAIRGVWPNARQVDRADAPALLGRDSSPVLLLVRTATAGAAELDELLAIRPDAAVINTGWPTPGIHQQTIFSYGSAAVNAAVVCERLVAGPQMPSVSP